MKTLILAEKPSVGKDIARVLKCARGGRGYLEGDNYVVTWSLGHLVTLADPENYDKKYKTWNLDDLPIMPEKLELVVIRESAKQFAVVKEQSHRKDVDAIVIATDAGREGELVARWIIEKAKCRKPLKRLWISSVTDKAIREGFANLKDARNYANLGESARARAEADWLVGINATRCLTTKFNSQLSCGRVQTPTVAIISAREEEIRSFKPVKYYGLSAACDKFKLTWRDTKSGEARCFDEKRVTDIRESLKNMNEGIVKEVIKKAKTMYPPKLYDLTELQRDANKRYGFTPKETLSVMQGLYERHKVLTYPRTDSRYLSSDITPTIPERLRACSQRPFGKICASLLAKPIRANPNFVDDKQVGDHHAIIPTEQSANYADFNDRERKVYELVVMRFLTVLYPPFQYEQTTFKVKIGQETFAANGKTVISAGFKEIFISAPEEDEEIEEKEQTLPALKSGDKINIKAINVTSGVTKPPSPFNEATLLSAMENPAKYMSESDKNLSKTLTETGGLGTVATRADIIEKLFDTFLIEKKGKDIYTTSKGRQLLKLVPDDLRSPALTGRWETRFSLIADGAMNKDEFLNEIRAYTFKIIAEIKNSQMIFKHDNITNARCPECGKFMLEINGKKGKTLVCQDRECDFRKTVSVVTNARCPHCHKRLEIVGEGTGKRVICECGYRESYESFSKRKKQESDAMNKRDVQEYMSKMQREAGNGGKNSAIADALKGLKF
ncbi:MAG: DNA topoisomerase III [Clostridiales bacterium]|jgi:DNA topoisomerase-3|nr:DNA topoisomerase III [Clostridiales bacterium]